MNIQDLLVYRSSSPVKHQAGMAFDGTNVLLDHWIASWDTKKPLLDIGCGNCNNAIAAAQQGAKVLAGEMSHQTIASLEQEHGHENNLSFHYVKLPDEVPFMEESISGVLCSEVLHFLTHDEVLGTLSEVHRILKPEGTMVVCCGSEDAKALQKTGFVEAQEKKREKEPDHLHHIDDILSLMEKGLRSYKLPADDIQEGIEFYRSLMPHSRFNLFNKHQLAETFEKNGFKVEHLQSGPAPHYPMWDHGDHDQIRIIAKKI
ncbi:class I SAM-dependent methyltransferase [Parendozoicomonas haliclonae]|uniref:Methyltransferase type 11 domain-containing protein n=1 Tax=Parendozoicomonas haliclonae TaxID=1960125 RepID=A0A1X7AL59_9GAMM|nr:class I SAM-dependent methyltransferase [Parendozoicomonas haliclonae]SMA48603.1 hypothetical protein EHSB41UT_02806 [Parendozoicomonas haliclonae]